MARLWSEVQRSQYFGNEFVDARFTGCGFNQFTGFAIFREPLLCVQYSTVFRTSCLKLVSLVACCLFLFIFSLIVSFSVLCFVWCGVILFCLVLIVVKRVIQ